MYMSSEAGEGVEGGSGRKEYLRGLVLYSFLSFFPSNPLAVLMLVVAAEDHFSTVSKLK